MSKALIREWVPPIALRAANRLIGAETRFRGPYIDWTSAIAATSGYAHEDILQRVRVATERALASNQSYEQDGVVNNSPPPSHALSSLLAIAGSIGGVATVVDFGGSLATHYLRWRPWLRVLRDVRWHVIEQPHFAEAGRQLFAGHPAVSFGSTIDSARDLRPHIVLASGSIQYVQDPMAKLQELMGLRPAGIVLDRTICADDGRQRLLTQHVPWTIVRASYPMWLLSQASIAACLDRHYTHLVDFVSDDPPIRQAHHRATYRGSAWLRKLPFPAIESSVAQTDSPNAHQRL
ncbi:methyltransferase, TIGR04325 family [Rhodanobacter sp. KK11]|jgi:putative methyltransferase (TIGR04325 family)|uniref:methyltransferase, TIGR04325 family n=1 Tax=Rhodanobacter sp. KK11 TaxID=3083255 RepID=UPI0029663C64|nr:methyltransferase, TIGR04325 family [Rhodanobacter sp. KK11]MDW2980595.1 methyltransferase, TIGR04325 family [Rhodanobacter sp. KK11]